MSGLLNTQQYQELQQTIANFNASIQVLINLVNKTPEPYSEPVQEPVLPPKVVFTPEPTKIPVKNTRVNYLTSNYPARIDTMVIGEVVHFSLRPGFDAVGYRKALIAYASSRYGKGSFKTRLPKQIPVNFVELTRNF